MAGSGDLRRFGVNGRSSSVRVWWGISPTASSWSDSLHGGGAEAAFEALVARHGPMVISVCRQVLGTSHDAEDAFQATFLILVRPAGAIRSRDSIGSWLYGVARRVSARARYDIARRRTREQRAGAEVGQAAERRPEAGDELAASLAEEIAQPSRRNTERPCSSASSAARRMPRRLGS